MSDKGQYKVVSDGGGYNTHIYDPDGKELTNVISASWTVYAGSLGVLTLEIENVAMDIRANDQSTVIIQHSTEIIQQ